MECYGGIELAKERTGRPSDIDAWRERQYLDLQQRKIHIPSNSITWDMLTDTVKRLLTLLPEGRYGGDGSTFDIAVDESGRVVFVPIIYGGGEYGLCVYGAEYGVYGAAKYGEAAYGSYTYLTGKFGGTGGYGYVKYG